MNKEKFLFNFEKKAKNTIDKYKLINKNDRVLVAASGGKDSMAVLYLLNKFGYNLEALYIDLHLGKYSEECYDKIKEFCDKNKIKLHVYKIKTHFGMRMCNIRQGVQQEKRVSNCLVCGIIKKWILNREARRLKADKIATGHNLDDESQTVIVNFLQGNLYLGANSGPKTGSVRDKKFVPRIKPLFFVAEEDVRKYLRLMKLPVNPDKCPCGISSLRIKTRSFLNKYSEKEKLMIVNNFLKMLPMIKGKFNKVRISYCISCGEPARKELCKKCEILNLNKKGGNKNGEKRS